MQNRLSENHHQQNFKTNKPMKAFWSVFFCLIMMGTCCAIFLLGKQDSELREKYGSSSTSLEKKSNDIVSPSRQEPMIDTSKNSFSSFASVNWQGTKEDFLSCFSKPENANQQIAIPIETIVLLNQLINSAGLSSNFKATIGDETTPLLLSIQRKWFDVADILLCNGANPNAPISPALSSPLRQAVLFQNFQTVSNLLAHGADPNKVEMGGNSVSAAVKSWNTKMQLIQQGTSLNSDGSVSMPTTTDLADDILNGEAESADETSLQILRLLLEAGGRPNLTNELGIDALGSAAVANNLTAFKLLLAFYPDPNTCLFHIQNTDVPISFVLAAQGQRFLPFLQAMNDAGVDLFKPYSGMTILDSAKDPKVSAWLRQISLEDRK